MDRKAKALGLGGIIQDLAGEVQVSYRCNLTNEFWPEVAETMALRKKMSICLELGLN